MCETIQNQSATAAEEVTLLRDEQGAMRLAQRDGPPVVVTAARLFPLTNPGQFITLSDSEGNEVCSIRDISTLEAESAEILHAELDRAYFLPRIKHILDIRESMGILKWSVQTDRGSRQFEVRSRDDIRYIRSGRLQMIIKDIDGNRFEIWDAARMDLRSRALLDRFL